MKRMQNINRVGFTTSIPVEVLLAAGKVPVDLNNIFISSDDKSAYIDKAEQDGFPRNLCAWIKGIYAAVKHGGIDEVVGVVQGDCSNALALLEVLKEQGINTYFFSYPYDKDEIFMKLSLSNLMEHYHVGIKKVMEQKARLDNIRKKVKKIDRMTYHDNLVTSFENHYFQVCASDFNSDPDAYELEVDEFIKDASKRKPIKQQLRIGYMGVPPIFPDLYDYIDSHDARVVYNEVQQQFAMPHNTKELHEQYLRFTYPYDVFGRVKVIKTEMKKRKLDGIIHYVQSFCFRQVEDLIIRRALDIPMILIEGDRPAPLDARTKLRIEVFLEMLKSRK